MFISTFVNLSSNALILFFFYPTNFATQFFFINIYMILKLSMNNTT